MTTRILGSPPDARHSDAISTDAISTDALRTDSLVTSATGFGCMGLSQGYGPADDTESVATIHAALEEGVTLFDTAMSYGEGHNEELVGSALRSSGVPREQLQVATKFGIMRRPDGVGLDADPAAIERYCDESLQRLGLEVIDLYYLHRVDPRFPIEESVGAMARLVEVGKVRHLGVSEVTPDELVRAHATHPIAAVQFEWSLMWREPERATGAEPGIVPIARRLGVGLVPYSPLGRGLLSGRLAQDEVLESPFRAMDPRFQEEYLHRNLEQVAALATLAGRWHVTPAQLALAWLLAQGEDVVPIPGSRRAHRARENAWAADVVLDADQLAQLDRTVPPHEWAGDRRSFAVPQTTRTSTPFASPREGVPQ